MELSASQYGLQAAAGVRDTEHPTTSSRQAHGSADNLRTLEEQFQLPGLAERAPWWRQRRSHICAAVLAAVTLALLTFGLLHYASVRSAQTNAMIISKVAFASCTQRWNGPNSVWQTARSHMPKRAFTGLHESVVAEHCHGHTDARHLSDDVSHLPSAA